MYLYKFICIYIIYIVKLFNNIKIVLTKKYKNFKKMSYSISSLRESILRQLDYSVKKEQWVNEIFTLDENFKVSLKEKPVNFSIVAMSIFLDKYSRVINGNKEKWADTIIRVIEGIFSIRKTHMKKNNLYWDEKSNQAKAQIYAMKMFERKVLPGGRGLWAIGMQNAMPLNNCAAVSTETDLTVAAVWTMDALMLGAGVGFDCKWKGKIVMPNKSDTFTYQISDDREGWCRALYYLMSSYIPDENGNTNKFPLFDYSLIRKKGESIKGFGGISSGPSPLIELMKKIEVYLDCYYDVNVLNKKACLAIGTATRKLRQFYYLDDESFEHLVSTVEKNTKKTYGNVRLIIDVFNSIAHCVASGNVRRSAEIALASPDDDEFYNIKDSNVFDLKTYSYSKELAEKSHNPERHIISYASNNTVVFDKTSQFENKLPKVIENVITNGEPGIANSINMKRYARVNKTPTVAGINNEYEFHDCLGNKIDCYVSPREMEQDLATLLNPCGEIPLVSFELCNLAEIYLSNIIKDCSSDEYVKELDICLELATFYTSTISLLPTHSQLTNNVIARNRRTGVGLGGVAKIYEKMPSSKFIAMLRRAYRLVRSFNHKYAMEAGVVDSIRVTTNKPSGTTSLLTETTAGIHFPIVNRFVARGMQISKDSDMHKFLTKLGLKSEQYVYNPNSDFFKFGLDQGDIRCGQQVTVWEQFLIASTFQKWWSDNSVSVSLYFTKDEQKDLQRIITSHISDLKCISLFPTTESGSYLQEPFKAITEDEYNEMIKTYPYINWNDMDQQNDKDATPTMYCDGDKCVIEK